VRWWEYRPDIPQGLRAMGGGRCYFEAATGNLDDCRYVVDAATANLLYTIASFKYPEDWMGLPYSPAGQTTPARML